MLTLKMHRLGVKPIIISWINEFLTGRLHRVKIGGDFSDWILNPMGIPQGTVLGMILFGIFIHDVPLDFKNDIHLNPPESFGKGCKFVDDLNMWATGPTSEKIKI